MKKFYAWIPKWLFGILCLALGVLLQFVTSAVLGIWGSVKVITPPGGNFAVERLVGRIQTNAPIKQPILAFQSQITATTTPLVITKEKIVYITTPSGDESWKADLQPILAEKGIKGSGAVEFNKPASDDYYFALEVLLTGKLTAIEGDDGKWWVGTDNPGINLSGYDIVKVKSRDKSFATICVSALYNGTFGGQITWQPWNTGLSIGGGYCQKAFAEIGWVIKQ